MGLKTFLKKIIDQTPLYAPVQTSIEKKRQKKELAQWNKKKDAVPPHLIKQEALLLYAKKYKITQLIETGTYLGEMIEAMKNHFDRVYSIELSDHLHKKAQRRFTHDKNVELIQGDSGEVLEHLMKTINKKTLFWLDGHYSAGVTARGKKDTPIYEELKHIFDSSDLGHIIVIDDARCFGSDPGYPSIEELSLFIKKYKPDTSLVIENDSIRILPKD